MLIASIADLRAWLDEIRRWNSDSIEVVEESQTALRVRLYTETHRYSISAKAATYIGPPQEFSDDSYLGCTVSCRRPYAGEEHTRGNDLADGKLTAETWSRIVHDIVGYELVEIHRPKLAKPVPATETA